MKHTGISMSGEMAGKIESFLSGTETVSQFVFQATQEKIKRMEVRDKTARLQLFERDVEMLMPLVEEVLKRLGK